LSVLCRNQNFSVIVGVGVRRALSV